MKKVFNTRTIAEIAIFAAIGYVLDLFQGACFKGVFPNGGSIGFAMVPLFLVCFRHGFWAGFLTGAIMGLLSMMGGIYYISDTWYKVFAQVALDYFLAYPVCAVAGLFRGLLKRDISSRRKYFWVGIGIFLGGMLKLTCHYLSGILFWPTDYWNVGGASIYSILYNGSYVLPCVIISLIIMEIILWKQPKIYLVDREEK